MAHAEQDLNGTLNEKANEKEREAIEWEVITNYENPIAQELGEFTRSNYSDVLVSYTTDHSTDWGVVYISLWKRLLPFLVSADSLLDFDNLNPWNP